MRNPSSNFRFLGGVLLAAVLVTLTACAPNETMNLKLTPTPTAPAATGSIHLSTDQRADSIVRLQVQNLPAPDKLTPPASTYVVWEQEADSIVKRGPLTNDGLRFTASGRDFHLFITAEQNASIDQPAGPTVLETMVSW